MVSWDIGLASPASPPGRSSGPPSTSHAWHPWKKGEGLVAVTLVRTLTSKGDRRKDTYLVSGLAASEDEESSSSAEGTAEESVGVGERGFTRLIGLPLNQISWGDSPGGVWGEWGGGDPGGVWGEWGWEGDPGGYGESEEEEETLGGYKESEEEEETLGGYGESENEEETLGGLWGECTLAGDTLEEMVVVERGLAHFIPLGKSAPLEEETLRGESAP